MNTWITIYFVVVSALYIAVVLLQQKNSSLGSMMGGDDAGEQMARTRRGAEAFLHKATVILSFLLLGGAGYAMFM